MDISLYNYGIMRLLILAMIYQIGKREILNIYTFNSCKALTDSVVVGGLHGA